MNFIYLLIYFIINGYAQLNLSLKIYSSFFYKRNNCRIYINENLFFIPKFKD